jgi:hypothetical protein
MNGTARWHHSRVELGFVGIHRKAVTVLLSNESERSISIEKQLGVGFGNLNQPRDR